MTTKQQNDISSMCWNRPTASSSSAAVAAANTSTVNVYKTVQRRHRGSSREREKNEGIQPIRLFSRARRHWNENQAQRNEKKRRILTAYRTHTLERWHDEHTRKVRDDALTNTQQEEFDYNKVVCTHYSCYSVFAGPIYRTHSFIRRAYFIRFGRRRLPLCFKRNKKEEKNNNEFNWKKLNATGFSLYTNFHRW